MCGGAGGGGAGGGAGGIQNQKQEPHTKMWGTTLRDFLNFGTWRRQKRNNSATRPQFFVLTTPKTKQFCETAAIFEELTTSKNEAILRDFLQKWNVECRADGLVPMRFAIFPLHVSKVPRLPRKSDARSYEVLHLSRKIIFPKPKCNPSQENSARTS